MRWMSLCLVALAALGVTDSAAAQGKRFDGVTLRVGTWGGTNRDAQKETAAVELEKLGAKVDYVIGSPQDNFAKIIAARGRDVPMDTFEILGSMLPEVLGRNALDELNYANIPNASALRSDERRKHVVAHWTTQEMIFYNADKFKELGLTPPKTLTDLRDRRLAGRIMIPDITSGGGIEGLGGFALAAGGDERNVEPGLKLIKEIDALKFWKVGADVITGFKSGDIWVAVAHAGWAIRTAYAGVPVVTVPPQYGQKRGLVKEGFLGVVRGTKVKEAAEFYVNTLLSEDVQYHMSIKTGQIAVNPKVFPRLATVPVVKDLTVLDSDKIANMVRLDPDKINLSQWIDQWNRMISR